MSSSLRLYFIIFPRGRAVELLHCRIADMSDVSALSAHYVVLSHVTASSTPTYSDYFSLTILISTPQHSPCLRRQNHGKLSDAYQSSQQFQNPVYKIARQDIGVQHRTVCCPTSGCLQLQLYSSCSQLISTLGFEISSFSSSSFDGHAEGC